MFTTADLCDAFGEDVIIAEPIFFQYGKKKKIFGPIATVKVFEDNVLVKEALEVISPGSILVVDGGGSRQCALMGDNLAEIAIKRKLAGVIIYGCIRDSAIINKMDVSIFAIGTNPRKSIKQGNGLTDIAVQFAGVNWQPGHFVYADEDGILVTEEPLDGIY
ncbi:ribonuclease E activity regulator RraA [Halalkalibacterium ligniniphilum]|uniref:ribonuclease E activity regulator RraA n=1 Tax=Halalkalibacterium ligniniphilum TaxID=1134413 RepID=UPI0003474D78|nr:ribonuclease E activity regulator RraA [Halalkalibacterium ligniniphilum]